MITTVKSAFKAKEVRHKILFTLIMLVIFRLGTHITVPNIDAKAIQGVTSSGVGGLLNTFSGGGLTNYSIFAMGVSPYITAQIIVQLLQTDIVPKFVEWSKQGDVGRQKLNRVTKYLTVFLAFVQSIGVTAGFNYLSGMTLVKHPTIVTFFEIGLILTSGTMLATWFGDMITDRGLGNGVSVIIFTGIIARTPSAIRQLIQQELVGATHKQLVGHILFLAGVLIAVILIVLLVTWVQQANRKIPIQYTRRAAGASDTSYLPLKVNVAGVIPVIFASSMIATPQTILMAFAKKYTGHHWYDMLKNIFTMQTTSGSILYALLIIVFTFFYAFVQVNPEKLVENLQKQGSYIPGVRPGKATESYISGLLMRLSVVGALFLGLVAIIPLLAQNLFGLSQTIGLGGTSLLIVIGVAMDIINQLEGLVMKREYIGFVR